MKHQCQVLPEELGPYLLGQLDPHDEQRIATLVADCPSCTADVHALRPVVAALALTSSAAEPTRGRDTDTTAARVRRRAELRAS